MKYIFLTDIDGTLIKTGLPVPEAVRKSAEEFVQAGGYLGLSTGRAAKAAANVAASMPLNCPSAVLTGAVLYDFKENTTVFKTPLDASIFDLIHNIYISHPEVSITVATENDIFNIRMNEMLQNKGVFEDRTAPLIIPDEINSPLYKVLLTCDSVEKLESLKRVVEQTGPMHMAAASRHFYEITAKGVSKGTALERLREYFGGECMLFAAGDAETDLAMCAYADVFFVPESASESVKRFADVIIPSPVENGMCKAFEYVCEIIRKNSHHKS